MTVDVRLATIDDALELAQLRWRWRVDERGEQGMHREEFDAGFAEWWSAHRNSHIAWLAELDGSSMGMAWLAIVERVPGPGRWRRLSAYLQSVYVVPDHRGGGTGGRLIEAATDEARRRELDYVAVHPTQRSTALYRRAGFTESDGVLELRFDRA